MEGGKKGELGKVDREKTYYYNMFDIKLFCIKQIFENEINCRRGGAWIEAE